jgi:hypothetical protein
MILIYPENNISDYCVVSMKRLLIYKNEILVRHEVIETDDSSITLFSDNFAITKLNGNHTSFSQFEKSETYNKTTQLLIDISKIHGRQAYQALFDNLVAVYGNYLHARRNLIDSIEDVGFMKVVKKYFISINKRVVDTYTDVSDLKEMFKLDGNFSHNASVNNGLLEGFENDKLNLTRYIFETANQYGEVLSDRLKAHVFNSVDILNHQNLNSIIVCGDTTALGTLEKVDEVLKEVVKLNITSMRLFFDGLVTNSTVELKDKEYKLENQKGKINMLLNYQNA